VDRLDKDVLPQLKRIGGYGTESKGGLGSTAGKKKKKNTEEGKEGKRGIGLKQKKAPHGSQRASDLPHPNAGMESVNVTVVPTK